jgi:hypothetical protein
MSGWVIALIVLCYVLMGAVVTLVAMRLLDAPGAKYEYDECGYIAAIAFVWPLVVIVALFSMFGLLLVRIHKKGGAK